VGRFLGVNVVPSYQELGEPYDAIVITHLTRAKGMFDQAVDTLGAERVLAPDLLGLRPPQQQGAA
jgi:hypothetical protein